MEVIEVKGEFISIELLSSYVKPIFDKRIIKAKEAKSFFPSGGRS